MSSLLEHLKFAWRQAWRYPGFSLTVALTLSLAIGANTAIFSLVNALMLKSLPYPHPERLGTVYARVTGAGASGAESGMGINGEMWELLRDHAPSLIPAVTSGESSGVNMQAGTQPGSAAQYLQGARVSAHYFDVLGLRPLLGRSFTDDEDRPHGPKAVILSYNIWRTAFAANPEVMGQSVLLKGEPHTVIGVLPQGAVTPTGADVFTALQPSRTGEGEGTNYDLSVRLRDGVSWQQADAEVGSAWSSIAQRFASRHPGAHKAFVTVPLQRSTTEELRPKVLALMVAAGLILLIACANLAGLALVRMLRRSGEMATRLALGASRWQLQKQLWLENLLLALVGGAAGVAVGFLALRGLLLLLPEHFLPVASVPLDVRVLGFTLAVSVLTSLFFGMLPALATRKVDLRSAIAGRGANAAGMRMRQGLIAGEVALTVVLLAAAGLLIRTLVHLESLPPGFDPAGVMTAKASLDDARYRAPADFRKLLNASTAAMRAIPGVENAAVALTLPYERALNDGFTFADGKQTGQQFGADEVYVTAGYFATMRIPVLAGRSFTDSDGQGSQPVAVVNQSFARKFYPGENAVGHTLNKGMRIVGVVADTQLSTHLSEDAAPLTSEETVFIPASQMDNGEFLATIHVWFQPSWVVRTRGPVEGVTAQMQRAMASVDSSLPFSGFYSMNDLVAQTLATQRIEVALLGAMALLALLLSAVGISSLVANLVVQRTREIGIRIALGSSIAQAMTQVGRSGLLAAAVGMVAGLALCAVVLRSMQTVLYGVTAYDAPTLGAVVGLLTVVTLMAAVLPTLRIARIDPAKTLRED
jgi:macrolide transport system ATP-binding/permease protein